MSCTTICLGVSPHTNQSKNWKEFGTNYLFGDDFREEMKLAYSKLVVAKALEDGFRYNANQEGMGGQNPLTFQHVESILFSGCVKTMISNDRITEIVACVFKWMYASNLESTSHLWIREAISCYFARCGMKVVLSTVNLSKAREHSVVRSTKKAATQSFLNGFKKSSMKEWGFSIEIDKTLNKDKTYPDDSHKCTTHDVTHFLSIKIKKRMCRSGGTTLLDRHNNVPNPLFTMTERIHSNMTCALRMGCPLTAVVARVMNLVDKLQTYGHMTDTSMMNQK